MEVPLRHSLRNLMDESNMSRASTFLERLISRTRSGLDSPISQARTRSH